MIDDSKPNKVNISKEVLEREKKIHKGTGKNNKCTNEDILRLLGFGSKEGEVSRSLMNKYAINKDFYCFDIDRVNNLCDIWGIRIEYLCGSDTYRTDNDILVAYDELQLSNYKRVKTMCGLMGFSVRLHARAIIEYDEYEESMGKIISSDFGFYIVDITPTDKNLLYFNNRFLVDIYVANEYISTFSIIELSSKINILLKSNKLIFDSYIYDNNTIAHIQSERQNDAMIYTKALKKDVD